ncbi:MAG: PfkB family carbohydrate kinase [Pseudomonadota bacterium]
MTNILVTGIAVVDFVLKVEEMPSTPEKYWTEEAAIVGGGCAANAAVAIARHGATAKLAARMGDDVIGDLILGELESEGVDTSLVHRAEGGKSSFSSIYVDRQGERQVVNFRGNDLIQGTDWLETGETFDVVLADNRRSPILEKSMQIARARDVPGVVDAEHEVDPDALRDATHIAFSHQGITEMTGIASIHDALTEVSRTYEAFVCATHGAEGTYFVDGKTIENIPAPQVDVVDTLGAGDIWHGLFALRLAETGSETNAITFANAGAALKCTKFGGRLGCPTRDETERFMQENGLCN